MLTPPQSLADLRALLVESLSGNTELRLGKRPASLLGDLLDLPRQTAVYSINELAEQVGVSPSTLSRLAQRLGYRGFGDFQDVFRRHVVGGGSFYSKHASRAVESGLSLQTKIAYSTNIAREESKNIARMLAGLREDSLAKTVVLLAHSTNIRVVGFRQSSALAGFFTYGLGMLRCNVELLSLPEHGSAHGLARLMAGDLVLAFGCAPYTRSTVSAARIAVSKGAKLIAVTDTPSSPLAIIADHAYIAPTDGTFYSNSMASMLVWCEMLLSLVALSLGESGLQALRERERLIEALEVELCESG